MRKITTIKENPQPDTNFHTNSRPKLDSVWQHTKQIQHNHHLTKLLGYQVYHQVKITA